MKKALILIGLFVVAIAVAWYFYQQKNATPVGQAQIIPPPQRQADPEPEPIKYPVAAIVTETVEVAEPEEDPIVLPSLEESDTVMVGLMADMFGADMLDQVFVLEMIISRIVATVDSLPSAKVAPLMLPVKSVPGKFMVMSADDEAAISPENAQRYEPMVTLATSLDASQVAGIYVHYYPLFQEAYQALGYPDGYFNDRLVEVINHLLETPDVRGVIEVRQNEAVYEFVNEDLEGLSAGQKACIRAGNDGCAQIKEKLRELKAAVTGPKGPSER